MLFDVPRNITRCGAKDMRPVNPEFTEFALARVDDLAVRQGWPALTRAQVRRGVLILTGLHSPYERIKTSTVMQLAEKNISRQCVIEVLSDLDVLNDDRPDVLGRWIDVRLAGLQGQIRAEIDAWVKVLRHGGPRRRPRAQATIETHLRCITPFLDDCATRYTTLREVVHEDLATYLAGRPSRHRAAIALRDLFSTLKKQRMIFRNPATRLREGANPIRVPTPLPVAVLQAVADAASKNPAMLLVVALIGVHAFYPRDIRNLPLGGIDLANGRLQHGDVNRPLDQFTRDAATAYLGYRNQRWPHSPNPHLLISQQSAKKLTPVSADFVQEMFDGLPVSARKLREDRILEELDAVGPDPLHLAVTFDIDPQTAIRYTAAAQPTPAVPRTSEPAAPSPR